MACFVISKGCRTFGLIADGDKEHGVEWKACLSNSLRSLEHCISLSLLHCMLHSDPNKSDFTAGDEQQHAHTHTCDSLPELDGVIEISLCM